MGESHWDWLHVQVTFAPKSKNNQTKVIQKNVTVYKHSVTLYFKVQFSLLADIFPQTPNLLLINS